MKILKQIQKITHFFVSTITEPLLFECSRDHARKTTYSFKKSTLTTYSFNDVFVQEVLKENAQRGKEIISRPQVSNFDAGLVSGTLANYT